MAHALAKEMTLHQTLHGYSDGHRLLASSISLNPRDQKTMLIMSDASGAGTIITSEGYLTGYPLPDSGLYAVGRTWNATEMARPGCVWTHTILIDFSDLANLRSMNFVEGLFRRPGSPNSFANYQGPITGLPYTAESSRFQGSETLIRQVLIGLYGCPKEKVVAPLSEAAGDLVFSIWAQQWPRLRRSFRFCTASFGDRSSEGARFDLQFAPLQDRAFKSRFSDILDVEKSPSVSGVWLDEALADIAGDGSNELRGFLREVGGETPGGRELFAPLCTLHRIIPNFGSDARNIEEAFSLIDAAFDAAPAASLRTILVSAAVRHPENLNRRSAEFILRHVDLLGSAFEFGGGALGAALWKLAPEMFLTAAGQNSNAYDLLGLSLELLDRDTLIHDLAEYPSLAPRLLELYSDLAGDSAFWKASGTDHAIDLIRVSKPSALTVLKGLLDVPGNTDVAETVIRELGAIDVLKGLDECGSSAGNRETQSAWSRWLAVCLVDSDVVATALNGDYSFDVRTLFEIATKSYPDYIPNDVGTDPWANAIARSRGRLEGAAQQFLCAYLLARALGFRSKSQSELTQYAFDEIYFGALHQRLPDEFWQLVERALPRSWWFDWDRCQRLRDAITEMYINRDLPAAAFPKITLDNAVFRELVYLASRNSRGRKYLKKVLRALKDQKSLEAQVRIIEDAL